MKIDRTVVRFARFALSVQRPPGGTGGDATSVQSDSSNEGALRSIRERESPGHETDHDLYGAGWCGEYRSAVARVFDFSGAERESRTFAR